MEAPDLCLARRIRALSEPLKPIPTDRSSMPVDLSTIRCVLFDVYGTLFISGSGDVGTAAALDRQDALDAALAACGWSDTVSVESITHWIRRHHAVSREQGIEFPEVDICAVWRDVLEEAGRVDVSEQDVRHLAVEYEARVNPVWPMPGLWRALRAVASQGLRMGIISNAQFYTPLLFPAFSGIMVTESGFDPSLCLWSYACGEAKPARKLFQRALDILGTEGIAPDEVLYIGNDMRNDIWPAATLGCRTALFAGDQRSLRLRADDPCCADVQPDGVLTDWRAFPPHS